MFLKMIREASQTRNLEIFIGLVTLMAVLSAGGIAILLYLLFS